MTSTSTPHAGSTRPNAAPTRDFAAPWAEQVQIIGRLGWWEWDLRSRQAIWSTGLYRIYGRSPDQGPPEQDEFLSHIHPEDRQPLLRCIAESLKTSSYSVEYRLFRYDNGEQRNVLARGSTEYDDQGEPIKHLGVAVDVTEQRRAEHQRQQSEALHRSLLEHAGLGIGLWSPDGRCLMMNPKGLSNLNMPLEQLVGRSAIELFGPDLGGRILGRIEHAVRIAEPITVEDHVPLPAGERWYRSTYSPITDERGAISGVQVIADDITGHRLAEADLRRALDAKTMLVREVNHRVRNNMQLICSTLMQQARSHPQASEALHAVEQRVRIMAAVHDRLYREPHVDRVDLGEMVTDLCTRLRDAVVDQAGRVQLHAHVPGRVEAPVDAAVPFGLVFNEMLCNAVKHGFPGDRTGRVDVTLERRDGEIVLRLVDDGAGLPEDIEPAAAKAGGMRTIHGVTRHQLGGTVTFNRLHRGTRGEIRFPATPLPDAPPAP